MSGVTLDPAPTAARTAVGWVPLAGLAELRAAMPTPMPVGVAGRPWALVVLDGEVTALHDVCPHRRVPLSAGTVATGPRGGQVLECGYHGWSYDRTGGCARIPALGEDVVPRGMSSVAVLATAVAGGLVWGCPDDAPGPPPVLDEDDVFLRAQVVEAAVDAVTAALGAPATAADAVRSGADHRGPLRFAVRPVDASRTALFPLVDADGLAAGVAAWVERIAALPFPSAPSLPAHER